MSMVINKNPPRMPTCVVVYENNWDGERDVAACLAYYDGNTLRDFKTGDSVFQYVGDRYLHISELEFSENSAALAREMNDKEKEDGWQ